jgi:uncharacterized protein DUF4386
MEPSMVNHQMNALKATAQRAGFLYLLFMIVAIVSEFSFPSFMVPGDATVTARNIGAMELVYRFSILTGFVTLVIHIFLVIILYKLLSDVDRSQAMLMVVLVAVGVSVALANMLQKFVPLVLLSGAEYLTVFTKPQLDALVLGFLRFHSGGAIIAMAFWGLWLFPFGILVIKSGFLPRILGMLLIVAGFGYLTNSVISIVLAEHRVFSRFMMPLYFGEVPIIFWLLIKGVRAPQVEA